MRRLRFEAEVRHRIDHFRDLLDRDPAEARKVIEALLEGPATFTPIETAAGRRYRVEGRIPEDCATPTARLLVGPTDGDWQV